MLTALSYAMPGEIQSLIGDLSPETTLSGIPVYRLRENLIAYCGGVGKVNAAMSTQRIIDEYHPDRIVNAGVAGCFENLSIGTIVLAESFCQHDVDTTAVGDPIGLVSTVNMVDFPTSDFEKACKAMDALNISYRTGKVATGEWFAVAGERASFIRDTFHPLLCEMEGGAVAQVCYRNGIPFMAIKSISDCLGFDQNYQFNFPAAMQDLNRVVMAFVNALED